MKSIKDINDRLAQLNRAAKDGIHVSNTVSALTTVLVNYESLDERTVMNSAIQCINDRNFERAKAYVWTLEN